MQVEQIPDISEDTSHHELLESTMRVVETLPDLAQTVIRLRHMEGMEMKEIADLIGSTEVAVRKALSRARKMLRARMVEVMCEK